MSNIRPEVVVYKQDMNSRWYSFMIDFINSKSKIKIFTLYLYYSCSTWKITRMNYGAQILLSFDQLMVLVSADFIYLVFQSQSLGAKCNTWSDPRRGSLFEHEIILNKIFDRVSMLLRSLSISIRLFNTIVDNSTNEYL